MNPVKEEQFWQIISYQWTNGGVCQVPGIIGGAVNSIVSCIPNPNFTLQYSSSWSLVRWNVAKLGGEDESSRLTKLKPELRAFSKNYATITKNNSVS